MNNSQTSHSNDHTTLTIALDAMGGDVGPEAVLPGAALALKTHPEIRFLVYGDQSQIESVLNRVHGPLKKRVRIIHTERMIQNDDKPSAALRNSKGTSMRAAIEAVKNGEAQAVVSAGNTGALMALAKMVLKTLPGIHRPAIASVFPTLSTDTIMLDLGANVLVDAENLAQFAVLGAVFAKARKNISTPSIGLLNVGSEATKGPEHIRRAAHILSNVRLPGTYYGFVEGDDITRGTVDVVVADGYAGNIALKTAEGVGRLTAQYFKRAIKSDPLSMIGGLLAYFAFKRFKTKVDPRLYNGGVFLGLGGLCVKSHGGTDALGFSSAINLAAELAAHGYISSVSEEISDLMSQDSFLSESMDENLI